MSETTSTQTAGSCGPACEGESLIIEVIGKNHPEGHTFRIFDESDYEQQEWLESQVEVEGLEDSVLHVWPWKGQPERNVWLDIETEGDDPVRVLLFEGAAATPRQMERQWNRLFPLVPLTLIKDPEPGLGQPEENIVPVRPGFVYVFREGRLWREVEVRYADSGAMEFLDIRLEDYRINGQPLLSADRRKAVSKPQGAIWIPVKSMDRCLLSSIEMAFSEVQWSSQRIAHLEQSASARSERCQTLKGLEPASGTPSQQQEGATAGRLISLLQLPEMRAREPYLEQHLPKPWKSVYDLQGGYSTSLYSQAREEAQAFASGQASARTAWDSARYRDAPLKGASSARVAALENLEHGASADLWGSLGTGSDVLHTPRESGYLGVMLQDTLFRIRHHVTAAVTAQTFFEILVETAKKGPHSDSAQLVQSVIVPEQLGGKDNPLHEYISHIDTTYFGPLNLQLRSAQRRIAREDLALAQQQVADLIRLPQYQSVLADLFTLKNADYIEGFAVCRDIFQALCQDANDMDSHSDTRVVSDSQIRDANDLLLSIVEDSSDQPLHKMIFPEASLLAEEGASDPLSCGDGSCRPDDLRTISKEVPDEEDLQTLTATALAGVAKDNSLNLASELKRWAAAVNSVLDGLDQHVRALLTKLQSRTFSVSGNFYGPLLRLAQAREPVLFGAIQFVARDAVPQGWLILGVYDPKINLKYGLTEADQEYRHESNQHRRFYGEMYDKDGNLLATTKKSNLPSDRTPDLATASQARNYKVYAAPADSEVVEAHRKMKSMSHWSDWIEEVRVPYLILAIEATNIWNEGKLFKTIRADKGRARAFSGAASAFADLSFAGIIAAERLSKEIGVWRGLPNTLDKTVFQTTAPLVKRLFPILVKVLPEIVTRRVIGGLATGGMALLVSAMDLVHEVETGDYDAAAAYGLAIAGTGMTIYGGLLLSKVAGSGVGALALAGPWGWVAAGIVLAVTGGVAALVLDDEPLEEWLKRGPFGSDQDKAYPHLQDNPEETFYRLVNLLSKPRINIQHVHDVNVKASEKGYVITPQQDREFSRVNRAVLVENNLCGLLDETSLVVEMRPVRITLSGSNWGVGKRRQVQTSAPEIIAEEPTPNGKRYYLELPESSGAELSPELEVRAQWSAIWNTETACHEMVFPAPKLADDLRFDPAAHSEPDFGSTEQPFWADQKTHSFESAG